MIKLMPGGPTDYILGKIFAGGGSEVSRELLVQTVDQYLGFSPEAPLHLQYFNYMTDLLTGDLGTSIWYDRPVSSIIIEALPWTLFVMVISISTMFSGAIIVGAIMAYRESTTFDSGLTTLFAISNSTPYYVAAFLLSTYFAYRWGLFPVAGRYSANVSPGLSINFFLDALHHAALPAISVIITGVGGIALQMRGNSIQILGEDYLQAGRLRGIPEFRLTYRYVARNAILPMYTQFMIALGAMFGGAVVLEQIFRYKGVGLYMYEAIDTRDYPLMMGCFLVITIAVVIGVFIADLTYGLIDPRVSGGGNNESF